MRKMIMAGIGFLVLIAVVFGIYKYTKDAYYAVGRNDGLIEANTSMLRQLSEIAGAIPICTLGQQREGKYIVTVKAEAILAIAKGTATVSLCQMP